MSITLKELKKEIKKVVDVAVKRDNMRAVVKNLDKEIIDRTKAGRGINKHGGAEKNLPELTENTVRIRKSISLSSDTRPEKSNVTRSGRLLKSTRTVAFRGRAEIRVNGSKQQEKTKRLLAVNSKKYGIRQFKWFGLTKKQISDTSRTLQKLVDRAARKFNNK